VVFQIQERSHLSDGLLHKNGHTTLSFAQLQIAVFIRNDNAGLQLTPLSVHAMLPT